MTPRPVAFEALNGCRVLVSRCPHATIPSDATSWHPQTIITGRAAREWWRATLFAPECEDSEPLDHGDASDFQGALKCAEALGADLRREVPI